VNPGRVFSELGKGVDVEKVLSGWVVVAVYINDPTILCRIASWGFYPCGVMSELQLPWGCAGRVPPVKKQAQIVL